MTNSQLTSEMSADAVDVVEAVDSMLPPDAPRCPSHGTPMMNLGGRHRCPDCSDRLVEEQQQRDNARAANERRQAVQEQRQAELEARIGAAGIPPRYQAHSFATFPVATPDAQRVCDTMRSYANTWPQNLEQGISVLLVGSTGTGKTGLACAVANQIMRDQGATAAFMSAYGAVRHQRDTWGRKAKTERSALDDLLLPDLLILDEVGASVGSDTEMAMLFEVLNGRYAARRPTLLISNLPVEDFVDGAGTRRPGLRSFLGPRVLDRYKDDGSFTLACKWPSLRRAPVQERADV